jgi:hypothetical protein
VDLESVLSQESVLHSSLLQQALPSTSQSTLVTNTISNLYILRVTPLTLSQTSLSNSLLPPLNADVTQWQETTATTIHTLRPTVNYKLGLVIGSTTFQHQLSRKETFILASNANALGSLIHMRYKNWVIPLITTCSLHWLEQAFTGLWLMCLKLEDC